MKGRKIECQTVDYYNNHIYILTRKEFDLLVYNQETNKVNYVAQIDSSSYYTASCIFEDKIIFLPANSNKICEYKISSDTIRYIPIEIKNSNKPFRECWSCVVNDGYIYIACGSNSLPLIKLNPNTYEAEGISEWNEVFEKRYGKQAVGSSRSNLCIINNELWLPLNEPNIILQYNLAESTYSFHEIKTDRTLFYTINGDGETIWLTGDKKAIYKWNIVEDTVSVLTNFPKDFENDNGKAEWSGLFYAGFQNDNEIVYLPLNGNMIIKCDKVSGELKKIGDMYDDMYCFHAFYLSDGEIYAEFDENGTYNLSDSVIIQPSDSCTSFGLFRDMVDATYSRVVRSDYPIEMTLYKEKYKGTLTAYINSL